MYFSCKINFCANRESLLLPSTPTHFPQRVCTRFRLFSRYSFSHFPLCSFRIVKYDRWVFLPTSYTPTDSHAVEHGVFPRQPSGWLTLRGIRGAVYLPNQTNPTTFIRGFLYRATGERQWRIKPPTQVRRAIARKSKTYSIYRGAAAEPASFSQC